jgi:hypothetical protein
VRGSRASIVLVAALSTAASGCGGGERQDAHEPSGTFKVDVVSARFPAHQRLARQEQLALTVRNADSRMIPNLAVSVSSFGRIDQQAGLADAERPVWVVDQAPRGGDTAYVSTWALGSVRAGQSRTFRWKVTAIEPGTHVVRWRVAAGLNGKARAETPSGGTPQGSFTVRISDRPAQARVDPRYGAVIRKG